VEHLDLLGVGANEVEDPVVGEGRMLEERRQRRDGFAAPGRCVEEQRAAPGGEGGDLAEDRFLPRTDPVREKKGRLGRGGRRRRRVRSALREPLVRVLR
jgi:hypothetical protein